MAVRLLMERGMGLRILMLAQICSMAGQAEKMMEAGDAKIDPTALAAVAIRAGNRDLKWPTHLFDHRLHLRRHRQEGRMIEIDEADHHAMIVACEMHLTETPDPAIAEVHPTDSLAGHRWTCLVGSLEVLHRIGSDVAHVEMVMTGVGEVVDPADQIDQKTLEAHHVARMRGET